MRHQALTVLDVASFSVDSVILRKPACIRSPLPIRGFGGCPAQHGDWIDRKSETSLRQAWLINHVRSSEHPKTK